MDTAGSRSRGGGVGGRGKVEGEKNLLFIFLKSKSQSILVLLFDTWKVGRRRLGKTGLNMVSNKISCRFIFRIK